MRILVTLPDDLRSALFTPALETRLETLGDVRWNRSNDQLNGEELRDRIADTDVCVTGWGSPKLTEEMLHDASALELLAHVGGSVAPVASDALYDRGVRVVSGIDGMAPFVAEGVLGMVLASFRRFPALDSALKRGEWPQLEAPDPTLFGTSVGFVGLGAVGEALLGLLAPFDVSVSVYDPYIDDERLSGHRFAERTGLDTALDSEIVSVHAAKTPETLGLLDVDRLARMPDGALLVNAARGAIVDHAALAAELRDGRLFAALDVFEPEPLPADSKLREFENALLVPHRAGNPARRRLVHIVIEEIERFAAGEALEHAIPRERYELMTDESLSASDG